VADFTYLRCWEGVVFFSFVIDAYSRRIVGWQFASHMRTDLVGTGRVRAREVRCPEADAILVAPVLPLGPTVAGTGGQPPAPSGPSSRRHPDIAQRDTRRWCGRATG
jgi:hypothetical protein